MPSEVSIVTGDHSVEALRRELAEAREQQTATAEILSLISSSSLDLGLVFAQVAATAVRLCDAYDAAIFQVEGEMLRIVAHHGQIPVIGPIGQARMSLTRGTPIGRAVLERQTLQVADLQAETEEYPEGSDFALSLGYRTSLAVPLVVSGAAVGAILMRRAEARQFTDRQIQLLKIFANQATIAIENARLFEAEQARTKELQARTRELTESLEYQTATSEVLNVISRSPTELQPVLDAIAATAARLCESMAASVWRVAGGRVRVVAQFGSPTNSSALPLTRGSVTGRAIVDRKTIHVHDLAAMVETEYPDVKENQQRVGHRTTLATPLVSQGEALGAISVRKNHVQPFSDRQIALLQTFADQAVIAIENARLFEEVQARTREVQESLDYQTATSDVLNVISRSPSDLQPVLAALVKSASRFCNADDVAIFRLEGDLLRGVAHHGPIAGPTGYVVPAVRGTTGGRCVLERRTIHVADLQAETEECPEGSAIARELDYRTIVSVPLLREGSPLGTIVLRRREARPFSDKQVELITTFADQAVIAIENTRLFEEVQARTKELQESLEYQTATSDVLGVISQSPTQLQPVVDAIVQTAKRLCEAERAHIWRLRDGRFDLLAHTLNDTELTAYLEQNPIPTGPNSFAGRAVLEKSVVHVPDVSAHPEIGTQSQLQRTHVRTMLVVPLLREGEPIGVLSLTRTKVPRPFSDKQIELVTTFASQAVIAINNVGLFEEVQARNRDLTALGEVGRAVSSTLDLRAVLKTIVDRAVILSGTDAGSIFYYREQFGRFELGETTGLDEDVIGKLRKIDIAAKDTGLGEAIANRQPLPIPDLTQRPSEPLRDAMLEAGFRASLIVPLLAVEGPIGTLILRRRQPGPFPASVVSLMQAFADQSAIALENARLFDEIAQKSRELEIASQHKSQFVANMSHELRTPLAAILGYAELIQEGFYGPQPEKSMDALSRISSNGKHLLGLINTVLDIAKIESGQFTLNMAEYAIESVVETVRSATESLAQNKKLALKTEVAKSLPIGLGDEQRLTQVLLNLVGNAIKFTDRGEVRVTAKAENGHLAVSVMDTGPGIAEQEQMRIFEQFHQVDSSLTKAKGGTGLGLAIAKQIVEMHGGRIWVESTPGKGATFRMELPTRAELRKSAP